MDYITRTTEIPAPSPPAADSYGIHGIHGKHDYTARHMASKDCSKGLITECKVKE